MSPAQSQRALTNLKDELIESGAAAFAECPYRTVKERAEEYADTMAEIVGNAIAEVQTIDARDLYRVILEGTNDFPAGPMPPYAFESLLMRLANEAKIRVDDLTVSWIGGN